MSDNKSFFDKIKEKLQDGAKDLRNRGENFRELTALRMQLSNHKKDAEALFTRYGRAVYENHPAEIQQIILQELRPITAEIARLEAELNSLTEKHDDETETEQPQRLLSDNSSAGTIAVVSQVSTNHPIRADEHKPFLGIGSAPTDTTTVKSTSEDKFSTK